MHQDAKMMIPTQWDYRANMPSICTCLSKSNANMSSFACQPFFQGPMHSSLQSGDRRVRNNACPLDMHVIQCNKRNGALIACLDLKSCNDMWEWSWEMGKNSIRASEISCSLASRRNVGVPYVSEGPFPSFLGCIGSPCLMTLINWQLCHYLKQLLSGKSFDCDCASQQGRDENCQFHTFSFCWPPNHTPSFGMLQCLLKSNVIAESYMNTMQTT